MHYLSTVLHRFTCPICQVNRVFRQVLCSEGYFTDNITDIIRYLQTSRDKAGFDLSRDRTSLTFVDHNGQVKTADIVRVVSSLATAQKKLRTVAARELVDRYIELLKPALVAFIRSHLRPTDNISATLFDAEVTRETFERYNREECRLAGVEYRPEEDPVCQVIDSTVKDLKNGYL